MSRYETGIHEPPLAIAEKLAEALTVPLPYFYCADDRLAALILRYATLDEADRKRVAALAVSTVTAADGVVVELAIHIGQLHAPFTDRTGTLGGRIAFVAQVGLEEAAVVLDRPGNHGLQAAELVSFDREPAPKESSEPHSPRPAPRHPSGARLAAGNGYAARIRPLAMVRTSARSRATSAAR
jgi:hypothetical protein